MEGGRWDDGGGSEATAGALLVVAGEDTQTDRHRTPRSPTSPAGRGKFKFQHPVCLPAAHANRLALPFLTGEQLKREGLI